MRPASRWGAPAYNGGMHATIAFRALTLTAALGIGLWAQPRQLKPGFNLFTKDQDVQLGKEAAGEIEKQVEIVNHAELTGYIVRIGQKLAAQPEADKYPYTFKVVNDKNINAFALPGGPAFVNTGLIAAADNEAQLAGVLAHEISHVALRHGTSQATKANFIQLAAGLGSSVLGSGSLLAQLGQLGIGFGANSVFLKYSRSAETDADLLGARILAKAGYNPLEMARFFEKLEKEGGSRGPQFLSSHPNPGNRMAAIQKEIGYLPKRAYTNGESAPLARAKAIVAALPAPKQAAGGKTAAPAALSIPDSRPSAQTKEYRGAGLRFSHPDNWRASASQDESSIIIAPPSGIQESQQGVNVGYGVLIGRERAGAQQANLAQWTRELIGKMQAGDPQIKIVEPSREVNVAGQRAMLTVLAGPSIFSGQSEIARVVTLARGPARYHFVLAAPASESETARAAFDRMLASLGFTQ